MELLSITNISKSTFVFTLYHEVFCASVGEDQCICTTENILRSVEGGLQYHTVRSPASVYLEPNETREFSPAVSAIPQLDEARKRGILQVKTISNSETSDPSGRT